MRYNASAVAFLGLVLAALLAVSPALAADPPAAPTTAKGHLPPHFKALGLTADQKAKVEQITGTAAAKIHDLEAQVAALRAQEHQDVLAVLTPAQRNAARRRLDRCIHADAG